MARQHTILKTELLCLLKKVEDGRFNQNIQLECKNKVRNNKYFNKFFAKYFHTHDMTKNINNSRIFSSQPRKSDPDPNVCMYSRKLDPHPVIKYTFRLKSLQQANKKTEKEIHKPVSYYYL